MAVFLAKEKFFKGNNFHVSCKRVIELIRPWFVSPGTHDPEPTAPILGLCNGIFTDRSIFSLSFPEKTKPVLVRWPYDVSFISCNWSSGSCGSLISGKFNLKINRSVKTPWHKHSRVVGSGSWVPGFTPKTFCTCHCFLSNVIIVCSC